MYARNWVLVAALGFGLLGSPVTTLAQVSGQGTTIVQPQGSTPQPPTGVDDPGITPPPTAAAPLAPPATPMGHQWVASAFVGTSFGAATEDRSASVGGSVGYLWNGWFGGEFAASFTPNFQHADAVFLTDNPNVNSYMLNAVGALPVGEDGQWQPFVSGGFGAITLRSDLLGDGGAADIAADENRFGGNIGVGLMTFAGSWGLRGDVRYFRAFGTTADNQFDDGSPNLLAGLDFWRANIGLAYRW